MSSYLFVVIGAVLVNNVVFGVVVIPVQTGLALLLAACVPSPGEPTPQPQERVLTAALGGDEVVAVTLAR